MKTLDYSEDVLTIGRSLGACPDCDANLYTEPDDFDLYGNPVYYGEWCPGCGWSSLDNGNEPW